VQTRGGVVSNAGQDVSEPGARVNAVQLGGDDERLHGRGPVAATIAAAEQPRLPAEGNATQGALGRIIREADPAVIEEPSERFPARQHVVHRLGNRVVLGQLAAAFLHPGLEVGDERRDVLAADGQARIG
jgi:hypothetical protein